MSDDEADGDDHHGGHDHGDRHHRGHHHHDLNEVAVAIVTVSSSRTPDDDPAGDAIEVAVEEHDGTHVGSRNLVPDDRGAIADAIAVSVDAADAVVTTGGTGISPDDVTVEVASSRFQKELPGFGELFRRRSESDVGDRMIGTRATAGVVDRTPVFCLPGSENAARLGATLAVPQLAHLAGLADR